VTDENQWNDLLSRAKNVGPLHTFGWMKMWNSFSNPRRILWTDNNVIWSFFLENGVAVGNRDLSLPPAPITDKIDLSEIKNMGASVVFWITNEVENPLFSALKISKKDHVPRTLLEVKEPTEYYNNLKKETRYQIRKAKKNDYLFGYIDPYICGEVVVNINKSSGSFRQGKPVSPNYLDPVIQQKKFSLAADCMKEKSLFFGIWKDNIPWAYCHMILGNDIAAISSFMTHDNHMKFGIGNLLFYEAARLSYERKIKYILSTYTPNCPGIMKFHESMGYRLMKQWKNVVIL